MLSGMLSSRRQSLELETFSEPLGVACIARHATLSPSAGVIGLCFALAIASPSPQFTNRMSEAILQSGGNSNLSERSPK